MSKQKRLLLKTKVYPGTNHFIDITLSYDKGGMNYFTGQVEERGYYLSVTPYHSVDGWREYTMFTGAKQLIKPAKRFSEKTLNSIEVPENVTKELLDHVLQKNNLKLEP